jgi:hypothetical protein
MAVSYYVMQSCKKYYRACTYLINCCCCGSAKPPSTAEAPPGCTAPVMSHLAPAHCCCNKQLSGPKQSVQRQSTNITMPQSLGQCRHFETDQYQPNILATASSTVLRFLHVGCPTPAQQLHCLHACIARQIRSQSTRSSCAQVTACQPKQGLDHHSHHVHAKNVWHAANGRQLPCLRLRCSQL